MYFAIYIGGSFNGMDAPAGSEGRVLLNYAKMLSSKGHSVFCFGNGGSAAAAPDWGSNKRYDNTHMLSNTEVFNHTYDVIINVPKELALGGGLENTVCNDYNKLAPVLLHVYFSWGPDSDDYMKACTHNVLQPLPRSGHGLKAFTSKTRDIFFAPYPFREDNVLDLNTSGRDSMCWVAKGVFQDSWPSDTPMHEQAVKTLSIMAEVSNRLNIRCVFTMAETMCGERAKRLGVDSIVSSIKNKQLYNGLIPKCDIDAEFKRSRATVIPMNYLASCLDSASLGSLPLFMPNGNKPNQFFYYVPNTPVVDISTIGDVIDKVFTDDAYYEDHAQKVFDDMLFYSYDESYKMLMEIVKGEQVRVGVSAK